MPITVTLSSSNPGQLKGFLQNYYEKQVIMDEDTEQWIYVYNKPLEAVDIISTLIDNQDSYSISTHLKLDEYEPQIITSENVNDIIKSIFFLFYKEK